LAGGIAAKGINQDLSVYRRKSILLRILILEASLLPEDAA
jgi:hypothetical protein